MWAAARRIRNEADAQLAQQRQQFGLRVTSPERVLRLQRGDWVHGVRAANRGGAGLGQSDVSDLTLGNQRGQDADRVLDGSLGIDPVLVVRINVVRTEPLQRALDRGADVPRAAVEHTRATTGVRDDSEFRRQHHLVAPAPDRAANEFFVVLRAVDLGRVEVSDAEVQRPVNGADGFGLATVRIGVVGGHAHRAESNARDVESADRDVLDGFAPQLPDHANAGASRYS